MKNNALVADYLKRSEIRLEAIQILFRRESWADVVRESQEVVELLLKALLRHAKIEVPRIHDVGEILENHGKKYSPFLQKQLEEICEISRQLRRDRELAFYGSEDLTPSQFYKKKDGSYALQSATFVLEAVTREISGKTK